MERRHLALLLSPKTGKTHFLVRILAPMIKSEVASQRPVVLLLDGTNLTTGDGGTEQLARGFAAWRVLILGAAADNGIQVPSTDPDPAGAVSLLFKELDKLGRPVFVLFDEIGRLVQGNLPTVMPVLNILNGAMKLGNVHFVCAGSGMVHRRV